MGSHGIVHENESVVLTEVELERELTYNSEYHDWHLHYDYIVITCVMVWDSKT